MWVLSVAVEYLFRYLGPGWGQCQQTPSSGTARNTCDRAREIQAETTYQNQSSNSLSIMFIKLQWSITKINYRHWMRGIRVGSKRHSLRRHASWSKGFRLGEHIMWVLTIAVEYLFRYLGPGWGQCQQTPSSGTVQNACGQARGIQAETIYPNQSSNSLCIMFEFHSEIP